MACAIGVDSLYNLSCGAIINHFRRFEKELKILPENILFDLYYKLYQSNRICLLAWELMDIHVFARLLKVTNKRNQLLECFQSLMDHETKISEDLAVQYNMKCRCTHMYPAHIENTIDLGLRLGGFLSDAGWYVDSEKVLTACRNLCLTVPETPTSLRRTLECYHKLIHSQTAYCCFVAAAQTVNEATELIEKLRSLNELPNLAGLYREFSFYYYARSEYDKAYRWSIEALKQVVPGLPASVIIDVLRQVSKSCVVKRQFKKAEIVIEQAVRMAREVFEPTHVKIADALHDYGFFLLNFDSIRNSVKVYEKALRIKKALFKRKNLLIADVLEDFAYALYVYEYSTGRFKKAREHSEESINILKELLPPNHLLLASAIRVKALILEEIALDMQGNSLVDALFPDAEELHISALKLTIEALGDHSVQASKHYGNLGRLYQSMQKYKEAEEMQLKAIAIKEELLGLYDYEVGLSCGHLASLYNYHTHQHRKAEELYRRSIDISLKLFGESYTGLEYDYRGLLHIYNELEDLEKLAEITYALNQWKMLREQACLRENHIFEEKEGPLRPLSSVISVFFESESSPAEHGVEAKH